MSRRRRTSAAAVALLLIVLGVAGVGPAGASPGPAKVDQTAAGPGGARTADAPQDQLSLTIDTLSPTHLTKGKPVEMSGRITNLTDHAWTDLKVYLVMFSQPLTSSESLDLAVQDPTSVSASRRIVKLNTFATAGDLGPGDTTAYRLRVPHDVLGVSATSGVYPIGAQVLATPEDGVRGDTAVGRAYTLIPSLPTAPAHKSDVALIWPFTTHIQRRVDGTYVGSDRLIGEVSPGGRLRRLLDLARSGGDTKATVLVDPSLLDALADIAHARFGPPALDSGTEGSPTPTATRSPTTSRSGSERERDQVKAFLDDLVDFAHQHPVWTTAYGQPDLRALTEKGSRKRGGEVGAAASAATRSTLARFGIDARQVFWPTGGIASAQTLAHARGHSNRAAILSPTVVSEWDTSAGAMQQIGAGDGSLPVVVDDPGLMIGGTQHSSALETRQRLVSSAALAALSGRAAQTPDVTIVVDPSWDPGTEWARSEFYSALDAPWTTDVDADTELSGNLPSASVELPSGVRPTPIKRGQVRAASAIVRRGRLLSSVVGDDPERTAYYNQVAGLSSSQDWRTARTTGRKQADAQRDAINHKLDGVSVRVTPFVTLSGKTGRFPITITNHLKAPVRVGVRTHSENRSLRIDDIKPTEIGPGQSRTVTVTAEVGQVSNSAVTAQLVAPDGKTFGAPAQFSVRSSVVGVVIWIAMGIAGLLVVAAIARRLRNRHRDRAADNPADNPADNAGGPAQGTT